MPQFVRDVSEIEIIDGLVHISAKHGEWYCLPSTFRAFVEKAQRALDIFEIASHEPPVIKFRR